MVRTLWRHVLPRATVAPRRGADQPAVLVEQVDGQPVDLELAQVADLRVTGVPPRALGPGRDLLLAERVVQAEHPLDVLDRRELGGVRPADGLGRALRRPQLGVRLLQPLQLADHPVVAAVADRRGVAQVVGEAGGLDLVRHLGPAMPGVGGRLGQLRRRVGGSAHGLILPRAADTGGPSVRRRTTTRPARGRRSPPATGSARRTLGAGAGQPAGRGHDDPPQTLLGQADPAPRAADRVDHGAVTRERLVGRPGRDRRGQRTGPRASDRPRRPRPAPPSPARRAATGPGSPPAPRIGRAATIGTSAAQQCTAEPAPAPWTASSTAASPCSTSGGSTARTSP